MPAVRWKWGALQAYRSIQSRSPDSGHVGFEQTRVPTTVNAAFDLGFRVPYYISQIRRPGEKWPPESEFRVMAGWAGQLVCPENPRKHVGQSGGESGGELDAHGNWRMGWDSNPRYAFDVYALSRRAPSTARPPIRRARTIVRARPPRNPRPRPFSLSRRTAPRPGSAAATWRCPPARSRDEAAAWPAPPAPARCPGRRSAWQSSHPAAPPPGRGSGAP